MDLSAFVSNPGASPWITTTPNPKLVRQQVRDAKRAQLLQEASSLIPDQNKLGEMILKAEMSPADTAFAAEQLKSVYTDYLNKFQENPYYTFSKEGRDQVKRMQSIVADPNNTRFKALYNQSLEEKKRVVNNLGMVNYDKGAVKMVNKRTGQIEDVPVDQIDYSEYSPITGADEFNYRTNIAGFRMNPSEFRMNQEDYSKVVDKIDKFLGNTGDYKYQQIFGADGTASLLSTISSGNSTQLKEKANLLKSAIGLSESELNAVLARYYTPKILSGEKVTSRDAEKFLLELVEGVKNGHLESSQTYVSNPILEAQGKQLDNLAKKTVELGPGMGSTANLYGSKTINYAFQGQDRDAQVQVNNLHGRVLHTNTGQTYSVKTPSGEEKYPKINMSTLRVSQSLEPQNALIFNPLGIPVNDPTLSKIQDQIVPTYMGTVMVPYKMVDNQKKYLPLSYKGNDAQHEMMTYVEGRIGHINFKGGWDSLFKENEMDQEISTFVTRNNFPRPDIYEKGAKEFNDYVNNANFSEDRFESVGKGLIGANDELNLYNISYLVPIQGSTATDKARAIDVMYGVETKVGEPYYRADDVKNQNFQTTNSPGNYSTMGDL